MQEVTPESVRQLGAFVPAFGGDTLYDGPHCEEFKGSLSGRKHTVVHTEDDSAENDFDCVVIFLAADDAKREGCAPQMDRLMRLASALRPNGCGMVVALPGSGAPTRDALAELLGETGLVLYRHNALTTSNAPDDMSGYIAFVVRSTYNPMLHARDLMVAKHTDWAFDVLSQIPDELQRDPDVSARIAAEKMVCLLAWDRAAGEKDRLARFFFSQATFYNAVAVAPAACEVYLCHGEFWKRIGNPSMRRRLLRSVVHAAPVEERQQIDVPYSASEPERRDYTPPVWRAPARLPRVLFVTHPRPHYGLDVLYYGLCEVLGDANVVEYPYKPTLHGAKPEQLAHYPCMFNRAGQAVPLEALLRQMESGAFDLVVYGDLEGDVDSNSAKLIVKAAGNAPIVLFDAQDDPLDQWTKMNEYVGGGMQLHFKREMLACWNYGEHTVPLPFAYADRRIPSARIAPRSTPLFWAGHRQFGLRRLYLERIESTFGMDLGKSFTQEEYAAALGDSRIGLNIFGFGFDTVRYWEIPAHGAMLLGERLPIHVPHDFVDGESAVFFDDLPELEEKLAYWLAHPQETAAIAVRGHQHLMKYHTASARARQMLGWVQARVSRWGV